MTYRIRRPHSSAWTAICGSVTLAMLAAALWLGTAGPVQAQAPALEEARDAAQAAPDDDISLMDKRAALAVATLRRNKESAPIPKALALSEGDWWAGRLRELSAGLESGERTPADADALYAELMPVLQERRRDLAEALVWARSPDALVEVSPGQRAVAGAPEPASDEPAAETPAEAALDSAAETELAGETQTLEELHAAVAALYSTRIALLQYVTPALRGRVTGARLSVFRELQGELGLLFLNIRYQSLWIPSRVAEWPDLLRARPVAFALGILQLVLALLVFRWWRGWAPVGLMRLQELLLTARPRRRRNLRLARLLWYVDRLRRPLEWFALLSVFVATIDLPIVDQLEKAPWSVAQWILLGWFAVALLNAMTERGVAGLAGEAARLRQVSLVLVAGWLVLLGLGLDLAAEYLGKGTIYAWVWLLFQALALPLLLLLVALWRGEIFRQLEAEPRLPKWVERVLQRPRGPRSFAGAAMGGVFLIGLRLRQKFFVAVGELEWGRRLLANLYTRDMARESERRKDTAEPIPAELRGRLIAGEGKLVDKVARGHLARLVELAESGDGGVATLVAERGGGKTTMLRRLATRLDGQALVFDCPPGGYEAFHAAFAGALGLNAKEASPESMRRRLAQSGIRVVGIDNYHRLCRPMKGGDEDDERANTLMLSVGEDLLWVAAVDRAAWQYIYEWVGEGLVLGEALVFQLWTEEQLEDLIELRCAEAEIDPDFGKLVLPRQGEDSGQESAAEQNRRGFIRFLWSAADGNPGVALRLFADSLALTEGGAIEVRLPLQRSAAELERLKFSSLLALRVIAQCELAAPEEIMQSLRLPATQVRLGLAALRQQGWIEELDGRYRLSWPWYRTVTRVLARKNLLPREV